MVLIGVTPSHFKTPKKIIWVTYLLFDNAVSLRTYYLFIYYLGNVCRRIRDIKQPPTLSLFMHQPILKQPPERNVRNHPRR